MVWKPDVTVAAVVEQQGRFLMVEEHVGRRIVINQPAGHLEKNETLLQAVQRETLEETAWEFVPDAICGIYLLPVPERNLTYLRVAFTGNLIEHHPSRPLDRGIRRTLWMNRDEAQRAAASLRSTLVTQCMDDYLAGKRYPLSLLTHIQSSVD